MNRTRSRALLASSALGLLVLAGCSNGPLDGGAGPTSASGTSSGTDVPTAPSTMSGTSSESSQSSSSPSSSINAAADPSATLATRIVAAVQTEIRQHTGGTTDVAVSCPKLSGVSGSTGHATYPCTVEWAGLRYQGSLTVDAGSATTTYSFASARVPVTRDRIVKGIHAAVPAATAVRCAMSANVVITAGRDHLHCTADRGDLTSRDYDATVAQNGRITVIAR